MSSVSGINIRATPLPQNTNQKPVYHDENLFKHRFLDIYKKSSWQAVPGVSWLLTSVGVETDFYILEQDPSFNLCQAQRLAAEKPDSTIAKALEEYLKFYPNKQENNSSLHFINSEKQTDLNNKLMEAVKNRRAKEVHKALTLGADVNAIDKDGYTALSWAIYYDFEDIAHTLLSKMLKSIKGRKAICSMTKDNHTALWLALRQGYKDIAETLLSEMLKSTEGRKAIRYVENGLFEAICRGYKNIVDTLLSEMMKSLEGRKAISHIPDCGFTALGAAISFDFEDIARNLIPKMSIEGLAQSKDCLQRMSPLFEKIKPLIENRIITEFAYYKIPSNYTRGRIQKNSSEFWNNIPVDVKDIKELISEYTTELSVEEALEAIKQYLAKKTPGMNPNKEDALSYIENFLNKNKLPDTNIFSFSAARKIELPAETSNFPCNIS